MNVCSCEVQCSITHRSRQCKLWSAPCWCFAVVEYQLVLHAIALWKEKRAIDHHHALAYSSLDWLVKSLLRCLNFPSHYSAIVAMYSGMLKHMSIPNFS